MQSNKMIGVSSWWWREGLTEKVFACLTAAGSAFHSAGWETAATVALKSVALWREQAALGRSEDTGRDVRRDKWRDI